MDRSVSVSFLGQVFANPITRALPALSGFVCRIMDGLLALLMWFERQVRHSGEQSSSARARFEQLAQKIGNWFFFIAHLGLLVGRCTDYDGCRK